MQLIYESEHFEAGAADDPYVDRDDGGHLVIFPKKRVPNRVALSAKQACELMRLTMVIGEAMKKVMNEHGVDIGMINYQENGNWSVDKKSGPCLHIHLYGRAKSAKTQKYGQMLHLPHRREHPEFYEGFKPLTKGDVKAMKIEVKRLFKEEKYSDGRWNA